MQNTKHAANQSGQKKLELGNKLVIQLPSTLARYCWSGVSWFDFRTFVKGSHCLIRQARTGNVLYDAGPLIYFSLETEIRLWRRSELQTRRRNRSSGLDSCASKFCILPEITFSRSMSGACALDWQVSQTITLNWRTQRLLTPPPPPLHKVCVSLALSSWNDVLLNVTTALPSGGLKATRLKRKRNVWVSYFLVCAACENHFPLSSALGGFAWAVVGDSSQYVNIWCIGAGWNVCANEPIIPTGE